MSSDREDILTGHESPSHDINFKLIAPGLAAISRFIIWRWEKVGKRWTKVPKRWDGKSNSDAHDPKIWKSLRDAEVASVNSKNAVGIGFVFNNDGVVGIDLDDCRNPSTGAIQQWASDIVSSIDSYTEVSPSATGLKIFLRASPPAKFSKKHKRDGGGEIEVFSTKKFFTVTGQHLTGTPADICDRPDQFETMLISLGLWAPGKSTGRKQTPVAYASTSGDDDIQNAINALLVLSNFDDYHSWVIVGQSLKSLSDSLLDQWIAWSSQGSKFDLQSCQRKWASFSGSGYTIRTLFKMADDTGREWRIPKQKQCFGATAEFMPFTDDPLAEFSIELPNFAEAVSGSVKQPASTIEDDDDPHRLARGFLKWYGTTIDGYKKLQYWRGEYWRWNGMAYASVEPDEIRCELTRYIKTEFDRISQLKAEARSQEQGSREEFPTPQIVTRTLVANVTNALESLIVLSGSVSQPAWLGEPWNNACDLIPTRSGLLHLPSIADGDEGIIPPTAEFFNGTMVSSRYDENATCPHWMEFLESVWSGDRGNIDLLQEWMGYLLTPDTKHHKMMMIVGPPRSGKGTIGRLLQALFGNSIANPTFTSLAGNFGLWPLLNKTIAIISDARLSGHVDTVTILERLLSISGGDPQNVDRKCLPIVTGVSMPVRFTILTNELPRLPDSSGAIASRFLIIQMTKTFIDNEDKTLDMKLAGELPGILNWAIAGWRRLRDRDYFVPSESAKKIMRELRDLGSPVGAFVRDICITGPEWSIWTKDLFEEWKRWCELHGRDKPGNEQSFGKDLRSVVPNLDTKTTREQGVACRRYLGIGLKPYSVESTVESADGSKSGDSFDVSENSFDGF